MTSILSKLQEQFNIANIALEALQDDVMEPDGQTLDISTDVEDGKFFIGWSRRGYSNSKSFPIDENLAANVKAYCFDLIIMTRNL